MEINSSTDFVRMTRGALAASGFVRNEAEGMVWWDSASSSSGSSEFLGVPRTNSAEELRGTPKNLVLIHGANDHAGTWFRVAPALAKQYRVLIPDLAGHGESDPKSGPIPISLIVSRLESLLANERELALAGNSLGGWIALLYALKHPDQVSRLFLEASGGLARPLAVPLVARTREEALVILRAVHGPQFVAPEWVIEALLQRAVDSPMLRLTEALEHDVEPRLGEIHAPATLIWGADDGVVPVAYGEELQARIPGARLHVIEGAAHIPHLQQPESFLACLTATS